MEKIMARVTKAKLWTSILGVVILAAAAVAGYNHHVQVGKANRAATDQQAALDQARKLYSAMPMAFEPNKGQTDQRVQFLARGAGYSALLAENSAMLVLSDRQTGSRDVLTMDLVGSNKAPQTQGVEPLQGRSNYF